MCACYVHKYKSKAKYRHVQCAHVLYTNIKVKPRIDMFKSITFIHVSIVYD